MSVNLAVVVATCRPESMEIFLPAWEPLFNKHNVELIVVEDKPSTWESMPDFIPSRTGAIRSLGFLEAYRRGYDVVALDDDCLPPPDADPIAAYLDGFDTSFAVSSYYDIGHTFGLGEYMRGFPFYDRRISPPLLQYGGWHNVPDMDAVTQAAHEKNGPVEGYEFDQRVLAMPIGCAFTACIMNVAIRHEAIPMLYQFMMGIDRVGYDRYDDLWSGLFAKKICDHLGFPIVINGKASIVHTRASNTDANYAKEKDGYALNDRMWRQLEAVLLHSHSIVGCYRELIAQIHPNWFGPNGKIIVDGMRGWLRAIEETTINE